MKLSSSEDLITEILLLMKMNSFTSMKVPSATSTST